jgi:leucine dehydrogenase
MGHEQILLSHDPSCGYLGIIAIHDTTLGPALGGTRFWQYASTDEAITDALRLARGMTYKSAVAGINLGGGKSVIIGDNKRTDREALFRAHGRFIETLGGRYITAEDIGTSPADMEYIKLETDHVAGLLGLSGDPSPVTAYGVYVGMKAAAKVRWGSDSLTGKTVAVQGAGKVAYHLMQHLHAEGAELIVTDIDAEKVRRAVQEFGAHSVTPDAIYDQEADVYAPCALGATINDVTLPRLKIEIIAGGANNQLAEDRHGDELEKVGILYAPDYVINGGGVINVYGELHRWPVERAKKKAGEIYETLLRIFEIANRERIPTYRAADRLAEQRVSSVAGLDRMWVAGRAGKSGGSGR